MDKYITIFCTVPSIEVGKDIADNLIDSKLAACVNIIPGITSVYTWEGKKCTDNELLLVIKSKIELFNKIENKITNLHPYDVPEIISFPILNGHEPYLNWINENTI